MKVIGGSSHSELTNLIARKVGVRPCKILLEKFANNETNVQLLDQVRCQDVYIIQTGETLPPQRHPPSHVYLAGAVNSNDAVMELLLIINSCRLASAESVTVITPYFPYSKVSARPTSCLTDSSLCRETRSPASGLRSRPSCWPT